MRSNAPSIHIRISLSPPWLEDNGAIEYIWEIDCDRWWDTNGDDDDSPLMLSSCSIDANLSSRFLTVCNA